ncbi:MAG: ROK family protein [Candidatus Gastranaerophilaceae bacterium]
MKKALALDVGGTKIYNAIVNENGEIISEIEKHATPKTFDEIKKTFIEIIKKYENDVDVISFSTCGAVNNQNSKILGSTGNIAKGYPQMPFLELSTKPVFVENDANCAAWAEHEIGASVNCPTSVMITLGTGVGGGIIIDNKLLKGQNGAAGEMHFKMYSDKRRKCTCGSWDCFEIYASGTGLKITAQEMLKDQNVTTYDVMNGVKNKNQKMLDVYHRWEEDITNGIIGLANIFDPDCVVLSGSLAQFVETDKVEKIVNQEICTTPTRVVKATAGNYSGMIGAALLAFQKGVING